MHTVGSSFHSKASGWKTKFTVIFIRGGFRKKIRRGHCPSVTGESFGLLIFIRHKAAAFQAEKYYYLRFVYTYTISTKINYYLQREVAAKVQGTRPIFRLTPKPTNQPTTSLVVMMVCDYVINCNNS